MSNPADAEYRKNEVPSEWRERILGDVTTLLTGFPFKSSQYTDEASGTKLLRGDNIVQGQLRWDGVKRWPANGEAIDSMYRLREGDVVLAMDRPWIEAGLKYAAISDLDLPCLLVQRVACMRPTEGLSSSFLQYLIGSGGFTKHILSVETGTAVPHISGGQIKEYRFLCPPIDEQEAIAKLLRSLDGKIDLLHRQNKTLEAMAEALFRQWFVEDLDEDWIEYKVGDFAHHLKAAVNPAKTPEATFLHYSLPAFDDGKRPILETGRQILSNKFQVEPWSVLISKLNPRVPRIWPVGELAPEMQAVCSTEFQVLRPTSVAVFGYLYCLLSSSGAKDELASAASGTSGSHQRVRPEDILNIKTRLPTFSLAEEFSALILPNLTKLLANIAQIHSLENLRDALLPKLMSGEVRVQIQAAA